MLRLHQMLGAVVLGAFAMEGAGLLGANLEPFVVRSTALTPFQISLRINKVTNGRVAEMVVDDVPEGSYTERLGVRVGDRIVSVDGRAVGEFKGGFGQDSELSRKFLKRRTGERIRLGIAPANGSAQELITLVVPAGVGTIHP